jgi:hypothetical protein
LSDAFDNASDPRTVDQKEKLQRERSRAKEDFIRASLGTREGRIWFWDLLDECGVFRNPWAANALVTAHACGEMNVGQKVLSEVVRIVPDYFSTMLKENESD